MGLFFDCKPEENFNKLEITEEIRHENENDNINSTKLSKSNIDANDIKKDNSKSELIKKETNDTNKINKIESDNTKIKKEKKIKKNNDITINNTDEDVSNKKNIKDNTQSEKEKKDKNEVINAINSINFDNDKKKINNTIFINNSNVTISNRNNDSNNNSHTKNSNNKETKLKLKESEIKKEFNCFNTNEENIELDELINKVFNNNTKINNNKNNITESDLDNQYNKDYFEQLYSEQSQYNINYKPENEDHEKLINKLIETKEKINNKNKPKKKKKRIRAKTEYYTLKPKTFSRVMNNKQIKKNIPNYRKQTPKSNYNFIFNSYTFDRNKNFQKYKNNNNFGCFSLENSFNNNLCFSMLGKSLREPFYNHYNSNISFQQKNSLVKRNSRETQSRFSLQQSYLSNSSMFNINSSEINKNSKIINREKRLFNVVSKNIKKNKGNKEYKKNKSVEKKLENIEKENGKVNSHILFHQYRDIVEICLPSLEDSLINKSVLESSINNKIILNYNKLNSFNTSIILYDGNLYKVLDRKNNGFKLSKRYFQITKNCFKYYKDIESAKNDKLKQPLVQFDIRHIKDLQIVDHNFLKDIKIEGKDIEFVFCIYLYQNEDFFVFATDIENYGNSIFDVLNLLKNYYEDKK
jgi:hypothetical protein